MVYLIRCNTVSNTRREDANNQLRASYQKRWGENWQEGAKRDGYTSHEEGVAHAKQRREEMKQEQQKSIANSVKESAIEMADRKQMSGRQTQKFVNIAEQM